MNRADALRLAQADPQECQRQLSLTNGLTDADFTRSKGAYLRWAVEAKAGPPPGHAERQKRQERAQRSEGLSRERAAQQARQAQANEALERRRAELMRDPAAWARLEAEAATRLPALLRGKPTHVAYALALRHKLDEIVAGMAGLAASTG